MKRYFAPLGFREAENVCTCGHGVMEHDFDAMEFGCKTCKACRGFMVAPYVFVENVGEDRIRFQDPLRHVVLHSPSGFAWGFGGSGPSDLARSIFLDLFASDRVWVSPDGDIRPYVAGNGSPFPEPGGVGISYMEFKFAHVARWGQDEPWSITDQEITDWLVKRAKEEMQPVAGA